MKAIRVFILGVIVGVYLKWIIDEIYIRDHLRMIANENTQLKEHIRLREQPTSPKPKSARTTRATPQPDQRPAPAATTKPARRASAKDDLKKIKGIGPVMEKKLNAAGVNTFEQFSHLTPTQLQNIPGISKRVQQSADHLIGQAKKLARQ